MDHPERGQTILMVDDEPDLLKMVARQLKHRGYRILTATRGAEGLRLAKSRRPDLILLDIMMPQMKGREVCAELKADATTRHIPVIFLTALGLPDHIKSGLELGAEDYLVKPFHINDLQDRIRVCLLRHHATSTPESS